MREKCRARKVARIKCAKEERKPVLALWVYKSDERGKPQELGDTPVKEWACDKVKTCVTLLSERKKGVARARGFLLYSAYRMRVGRLCARNSASREHGDFPCDQHSGHASNTSMNTFDRRNETARDLYYDGALAILWDNCAYSSALQKKISAIGISWWGKHGTTTRLSHSRTCRSRNRLIQNGRPGAVQKFKTATASSLS